MDMKHDSLDDKELDAVLNAMTVPVFDADTMEKRVMAAIERGAISAKFAPKSRQQALHRSFWRTLGRETVGMAMVACIVLAVLIRMPDNKIATTGKADTGVGETVIATYIASVEQSAVYDAQEESLLDSLLSVADNTDTQKDTDEDAINKLLQDLSDDGYEPDDYWNYFMNG